MPVKLFLVILLMNGLPRKLLSFNIATFYLAIVFTFFSASSELTAKA